VSIKGHIDIWYYFRMGTPKNSQKTRTKLRLRVREVAESQGISMAVLARRADLGMSTAKRVWHNSQTGSIGAEPLTSIDLLVLEKIADVLDVNPWDLIRWKDEGKK
jgi:DNA-binding Xre family transcriptional regulator